MIIIIIEKIFEWRKLNFSLVIEKFNISETYLSIHNSKPWYIVCTRTSLNWKPLVMNLNKYCALVATKIPEKKREKNDSCNDDRTLIIKLIHFKHLLSIQMRSCPRENGKWTELLSSYRDQDFHPNPENFAPWRFVSKNNRTKCTSLAFGYDPSTWLGTELIDFGINERIKIKFSI